LISDQRRAVLLPSVAMFAWRGGRLPSPPRDFRGGLRAPPPLLRSEFSA
jgi:hypothetical protein